MPVYEYYCKNCEIEYELMRSVSHIDEPAFCSTCGQPGQRLLSHFSFKSNTFSAPKFGPASRGPLRSHSRAPTPEHNPPRV